ncbi:MAG TPA: hypothetical protein VGD02_11540 [Gemmatimonadaceae bacterium]
MKAALILTLSVALGTSSRAQSPAPRSVSVGVWRGSSLCLVRPSACHDEVVVYRIAPMTSRDSVSLDARKIVNGQEDDMGVLSCAVTAAGAQLTCPMRSGVWHFTIRGDNLTGEVRLPDGRKFRDVRATRSP